MPRFLVVVLVLLATLGMGGAAHAQVGDPPPLAKDVAAVVQWLAAKQPDRCTERCFVLTKLTLEGSVTAGAISFALEGSVLADHAVAIPLFGPPNKVRLDDVTDDGKPAAVGFEGDHYFAITSNKRFVLRGKLALDTDLALSIPGPLNALESKLTNGRVVEGDKLSGLSSTTIHFDGGADAAAKPAEPTVFQLSRAFRVLRETAFEYRLVLRSGNDLGVVRLPLSFGEKVLEVTGSTGWKVEGSELVLPTAGRTASIVITGSMAAAPKELTPDARSSYEWWLLESDAEHRVTASTDAASAKQIDSAESPIPRTQPTSRLFLAKRGERLELTVQTLSSVEALAAVVRDHHRSLVLTPRGDWVIDEQLTYENNGVDHLLFTPAGRPIFLATDNVAERILTNAGSSPAMTKEGDLSQLMIALRKGTHTARVQSISDVAFNKLGGALAVPAPDHPLTASRATVTVGLPRSFHPIVMLGGDHTVWFVGDEHLVVIAIAVIAAWLAMSTRRDRALLAIVLTGAWFLAPPAFVAAIATMVAAALFRVTGRLLKGSALPLARIAIVGVAGLALLIAGVSTRKYDAAAPSAQRPMDIPATSTAETKSLEYRDLDELKNKAGEVTGNFAAQGAAGGVLPGVAPVALPLPSAHRYVTTSRELVTRARPFTARIVYVTTFALMPLVALWGLALAALVWTHRARLVALRARLRELLAPAATPPAAEAPVAPAE